jgi:hypothetical protein
LTKRPPFVSRPNARRYSSLSRLAIGPLPTLALLLGVAQPAEARQPARWLPDVRHFSDLRADPMEPRHAAGFVRTNLLETRGPERPRWTLPDSAGAAKEVQATVSFGATLPLARLAEWEGGAMVIAVAAGVVGRFRVEQPSRDDLGQDWFVAFPVEAAFGDWSVRGRISHRSSHLGDEFVEATGASRIEFGGEAVDAHVARVIGGGRLYAGGSWIFNSYTGRTPVLRALRRSDRFVAQAGAEGEWQPWRTERLSFVGGLDAQLAERTAWQRQVAAAGGVRYAGRRHSLQLVVRGYDGPSALGEFFLTPERAWSLELVAGF